MSRKLALFLGVATAFSVPTLAQDTSLQSSLTLNVGFVTSPIADLRPRIVIAKQSAVGASVILNTAVVERHAFDALNLKRGEQGLKALVWSDEVAGVARLHSRNMADRDFFAHRGISGDLVSDRADSMKLGGWRAIGENIAFNRGFDDPVGKAVNSWLNSPSHRNNILNQDWRESAIGLAIPPDGSYYFTQVFLARK